MKKPKLIDNNRFLLRDVLIENSYDHEHLSIATGYWDLPGTAEIIGSFKNYRSIRLLIGVDPYVGSNQDLFPDLSFQNDLTQVANTKNVKDNEKILTLRRTAKTLIQLMNDGVLEVKIFRSPRLHAKAYILGGIEDPAPIGIVGSSNFTKAGLTSSAELNVLEDQPPMVVFNPPNVSMSHTHLSWFNGLWNDQEAIEWTGSLKIVLQDSPVGDLTYGAYDAYIKTLMTVYEDELVPPATLDDTSKDVLFNFQERNAGILINKLQRINVAILADSVGLGKTITAGAVIRYYLEHSAGDIQIIAPAALKRQWEDDLSSRLDIDIKDGGFEILSMQDVNAIQRVIDYYSAQWRKNRKVSLFVIDEAHNLRSSSGIRREKIVELLQQHPDAHVLLLTATPINNSLIDLVNQIELAHKGKLFTSTVHYKRPTDKTYEKIDFREALVRIQTLAKKAQAKDQPFDYSDYKVTLQEGLRNYLVRSTRQGIEAEAKNDPTLSKRSFPKSVIKSLNYAFDSKLMINFNARLEERIPSTFEGFDPRFLNLNTFSMFTQLTMHPFDLIRGLRDGSMVAAARGNKKLLKELNEPLLLDKPSKRFIESILQLVFLLGFPIYRSETYKNPYYGKNLDELRELNANKLLGIQLTVHNILRITWLKRLESSTQALIDSVQNYRRRIDLFEKYLLKGYFVALSDIDYLESEYDDGSELEKAFEDFEKNLSADDSSSKELKNRGIERKPAKSDVYQLEQLQKDINRDRSILNVLIETLTMSTHHELDPKLKALALEIKTIIEGKKYGKKVLVFSFFADTIKHLEKNLYKHFDENFLFRLQSAYLTGGSMDVNNTVSRFSPKSKNYEIKPEEFEVNFLFSTDILSEGQNLQDAAYLINYDLHWNPVRMIQRNGRINRLGSEFKEVLIENMRPTEDIEFYLKLVNRLENKINVIKSVVGLDQAVLHADDVNPMEFVDRIYKKGELPDADDEFLTVEDEHIFELRKFMANSTEERIHSIKSMPLGKWNYLPRETSLKKTSISLSEVSVQIDQSGTSTKEHIFSKIDCSGLYQGEFIDLKTALDSIKTTPDDNERKVDEISYDRYMVERISLAQSRREAKNNSNLFKLTKGQIQLLNLYVQNKTIDFDIRKLFEQGISDVMEKNQFNKLASKGSKEIKENGVLNISTIIELESLIQKLRSKEASIRQVGDSKGILYYAAKD